MIAGQLTRVQIGEIAVSRWWSFPYSYLTPTDYYCSSLRRILFLSSLFRLGRDRWTGQRPPGFFTFLLGGRLWEKGGIRKKEGVDVHAICLLVSPTRFEKPAGETSSWWLPLFLEVFLTWLRGGQSAREIGLCSSLACWILVDDAFPSSFKI